jgi:HEAT repeat protein
MINTTCARCSGDTDAAPAALPAPDQPGWLVCATLDGQTGAMACGMTDTQVAIGDELYAAAHQASPTGDFAAAKAKAEPLLDTIADSLAAYLVREDGAWLAMARYCLDKAAASAAVYEQPNIIALAPRSG